MSKSERDKKNKKIIISLHFLTNTCIIKACKNNYK